jgi:polar amino acid transport system permease protein
VIRYPELDPNTIAFVAGLLAMTANTGGYQSEIFRAGIQTVHSGQVEAARAIGFSRWGAMRHVILPQALRLVIPPLTNEYIGLLKASSLLLVIGIVELTEIGRRESFFQGKPFESFAIVTALYLLITVPVSKVIQYVERRYGIPGLGVHQVATTRV